MSLRHHDARYAQVLTVPTAAQLRRRVRPLVGGLVILGFAISLSVRADVGVAPWDVFHQGVAAATGLSFGTVVVLVGLVVLAAWIPLRQRAGPGTVVNALSVGFVAWPTSDSCCCPRWTTSRCGSGSSSPPSRASGWAPASTSVRASGRGRATG